MQLDPGRARDEIEMRSLESERETAKSGIGFAQGARAPRQLIQQHAFDVAERGVLPRRYVVRVERRRTDDLAGARTRGVGLDANEANAERRLGDVRHDVGSVAERDVDVVDGYSDDLQRINPSCAQVATRRPDRSKKRPLASPRPPPVDSTDCTNNSQSSARAGR